MNREYSAQKQSEVDTGAAVFNKATKAETKRELLKRLDHIQHLAWLSDFDEISRLLQAGYV
jgi:hypothetical protein